MDGRLNSPFGGEQHSIHSNRRAVPLDMKSLMASLFSIYEDQTYNTIHDLLVGRGGRKFLVLVDYGFIYEPQVSVVVKVQDVVYIFSWIIRQISNLDSPVSIGSLDFKDKLLIIIGSIFTALLVDKESLV